ncbi:response regulator [Undibacterium sp. RuRC25W]|uniref:response regulator n=1 Tax=Undibacterium sp. RuRC25W TaxID=3413047 RepID=UPI003BF17FA7
MINDTLPQRILIIEDDLKIAALLQDYFAASGYLVEQQHDGRSGLASVQHNPPDLVLLDLMLPHMDGITVCQSIRKFSQIPIIMLTARVEEVDRLLGLEVGADDYVCKPFSPREVVARAKIHLRRHSGKTPSASGFSVDPAGQRVLFEGSTLPLTPVEYRLLAEMISHPNRVFSRQHLLDIAHEDQRDINDRTIDSHIKNIRKKIQSKLPEPECLHSVYGVGYRFELPSSHR